MTPVFGRQAMEKIPSGIRLMRNSFLVGNVAILPCIFSRRLWNLRFALLGSSGPYVNLSTRNHKTFVNYASVPTGVKLLCSEVVLSLGTYLCSWAGISTCLSEVRQLLWHGWDV